MTEYVPFGPEWEKELMKLTKKDLIDLYRKAQINKVKMTMEVEK